MYIPLQTPVSPTSPVARLVRLLDVLCATIAARGAGGALTKPLFFLLWTRLRRTAARVVKVAARLTAGTPPPAPRPRPAKPRPSRPQLLRLPRGFGWVMFQVSGAAALGCQLQHLLAEPELARLAEDPAMRRLLNPLCRMLGVPARPMRPARRPAAVPPRPAATDPGSDRIPAGCNPNPPPPRLAV